MDSPTIKVPAPMPKEIRPWTLPTCREKNIEIFGMERPALICKAHSTAYGIPSGFSTGTLLDVDLNNPKKIVQFVERYGLPTTPYADQSERVEKRFISNDVFSDNPEQDGHDIWYDALNAAERSSEISLIGGFEPLNHYRDEGCSLGTEAANLIEGIRYKKEQVILMDDLVTTMAFMQLATLLFTGKAAYGDRAYDYVMHQICISRNREVFENRFSQLRWSLQMIDASEPELKVAKPGTFEMNEGTKIYVSDKFKTIEIALATFIDLAINPQPDPHAFIQEQTLRQMVNRNSNDQNPIYGSLTRAWAIQLLETLESHFSWNTCRVCGRPYKIRQQNMKAYINKEDANEDRLKDRNNARDKNGYCCKAHEQRIRRKKSKRVNNDKMDKAARKMDERDDRNDGTMNFNNSI